MDLTQETRERLRHELEDLMVWQRRLQTQIDGIRVLLNYDNQGRPEMTTGGDDEQE